MQKYFTKILKKFLNRKFDFNWKILVKFENPTMKTTQNESFPGGKGGHTNIYLNY
jgi:hypothetical protein